jgi:hypothetical protein
MTGLMNSQIMLHYMWKFCIKEEIVMGPGLTRVNVSVLDNPYRLGVAQEEIKELLDAPELIHFIIFYSLR